MAGYSTGEKLRAQAQASGSGSDLDGQIASLRNKINQLNGATGIEGASARNQAVAQYNALLQQKQQAGAQGATNSAQAQADATRKEMLGLGQGGIDRLKGDSTDAMVRNYLQGQMGAQALDPNATPFGGNTPTFNAQGYDAKGYDPTSAGAASWQAAQMGAAPQIGGGLPWDAATKGAYMTEATDAAAAGEGARNQLIRDAILQSGGNASDPSLAGAYAESLGQRNNASAQARNQLNMRANIENFGAQRQADLANQGANMSQAQFNAANQQQANSSNAGMQQQANMFNASNANQAAQFGAGAQNQAAQFSAGAQNQAGMFNTQNQMAGRQADFNAGNQARMYNQQQQTGAAGQLAGYNNQRNQMLSGAEQSQINLLGQQRFATNQPAQQFPSFQQFQSQPSGQSGVSYAPGYFQNMTPQGGGSRVTSVGGGGTGAFRGTTSGTTTKSFAPTQTGTPTWQQASQYVKPAQAQRNPFAAPTSQLPQLPGVKQPLNPTSMGY